MTSQDVSNYDIIEMYHVVIQVSIPDLNFRLSYHDLKLFIAIAQSLPFFQRSPDHEGMSANNKRVQVDSKSYSTTGGRYLVKCSD